MIKAIVFDVDDTLYDLSGPFKEAFHELYPLEELDLEGAFLASRRYSDSVYAKSLSGEMSMEDMYVYRFQNAFHDYGKNMDAQEALHFQEIYEKHQHMIHMTEAMQKFLKELSDKMVLGIITMDLPIISGIKSVLWRQPDGFRKTMYLYPENTE